LEVIKTLDNNAFSCVKPEKIPPSPTKIKLLPVNESSGSFHLLHMEIERLKEENEKLAHSVKETETKVTFVCLLSTDHELIPARNASLVAMHGSTSENVCYYPM
jgi:hypothetical protein